MKTRSDKPSTFAVAGFICLSRNIFDHEIAKDHERFFAWVDIIGNLARGVAAGHLQRGEFEATYTELAQRWNWSRAQVLRFIAYLKSAQMIEPVKVSGSVASKTIYRVVNYAKYNGVPSVLTHHAREETAKTPTKAPAVPVTVPVAVPVTVPVNTNNSFALTAYAVPVAVPVTVPVTVPPSIRKNKENNGEGEGATAPPIPLLVFGEFKRVVLTHGQYAKLTSKLNGTLNDYMETFDRWVNEAPDAKTPGGPRRKERHAYESILNWYQRDVKEGKIKVATPRGSYVIG